MTVFAQSQPTPSARETELAREAEHALAALSVNGGAITLRLADAERERDVRLPIGAVHLLLEILSAMADGRGVTVVPEDAELTTAQAADILNVSRPYLIGLLDRGAIRHRRVGTHRRVRLADLLAYERHAAQERERALDELVAQAQEHGMGYDRG